MKRASVSLLTYDLLAAKAQDEAIGAVIAYEKEALRVKAKKAAQAARLYKVDTLIKREEKFRFRNDLANRIYEIYEAL